MSKKDKDIGVAAMMRTAEAKMRKAVAADREAQAVPELIQFGSTVYLWRSEVAGVYVEPGFTKGDGTWHGPTTWLRMRRGTILRSDWPIERVRDALGLVDRTWLAEVWESF